MDIGDDLQIPLISYVSGTELVQVKPMVQLPGNIRIHDDRDDKVYRLM